MNSEIIKGKRAVAFFDILGFKDKVATMTIDELSDLYNKLIRNTEYFVFDETADKVIKKDICHRFIFSDSVFLVAYEDNEQSFVDLFTYAWRMMQIALATKFPMRGAITYGDVYIDTSKNIFIGEAIVQAAVWEGKQDWMGAIVDKSAIERYHSIFDGKDILNAVYSVLLPIYPVPLKDGTTEDLAVINWRTNIVSEHGIKSLFQYDASNDAVKRKVENSLTFAKAIRDNQLAYFDSAKVPAQYRKFIIADKVPDSEYCPQNGDEY